MRILLLVFLLVITLPGNAQHRKSKNSYARGTMFGYVGYNRSFYSNSTISFRGNGYDFDMAGSKAYDNDQQESWKLISPTIQPQFNGRIGYYIRDHWAISIGYDQMKYILADQDDVSLTGYFGEDTVNGWGGYYNGVDAVTDRSLFQYSNRGASGFIRLDVTRTDQWYATRSKDFAFSTNMGLGAGALLTYNDFLYAGRQDRQTMSLSGYGIAGHIGVRLEFFKHLFLQGTFTGGMLHQLNVKTRSSETTSYARHLYGYGEVDVALGFLFYIRPTNDCNSCPHW